MISPQGLILIYFHVPLSREAGNHRTGGGDALAVGDDVGNSVRKGSIMDHKPVIIKLHPDPEEYVEAETAFLRAVGLCITQWAFVDRQLFHLFKFGIGASTRRAAIVYYEQHTIGRRLDQVDGLLKSAFAEAKQVEYVKQWEKLRGRAKEFLPTRNLIAHQPVRRLGTSDGKKAIYIYGIYLEPYQRFLNKKPKALTEKDSLQTEDLIKHSLEVVTLEDDLKEFVHKIVKGAKT